MGEKVIMNRKIYAVFFGSERGGLAANLLFSVDVEKTPVGKPVGCIANPGGVL